jgi:carbon-monoxide dehydrogenase medium subunit
MKAAQFDYQAADSVEEALRHLTGAKALGGGQSLGPMLNLRLVRPGRVVEVATLPEARRCEERAEGYRIGGAMTHAEIEDGALDSLLQAAPTLAAFLRHVAGGIAYRAVRNKGTLAGSIAHADPAADWVLAMTALDAQLELVSAAGTRLLPMTQFMSGAFTTALAEGELIVGVIVPRRSAAMRWGYVKFCRKAGEFAEASAVAVFDPANGVARLLIGALDGAPAALPALAGAVATQGAAAITQEACLTAVNKVATGKDEVGNWQLAVAVRRCLLQAVGATESGVKQA